jgi:hypothetical protein
MSKPEYNSFDKCKGCEIDFPEVAQICGKMLDDFETYDGQVNQLIIKIQKVLLNQTEPGVSPEGVETK